MAWTVTRNKSVWGNLRVTVMKVSTDSASATIGTGLNNIVGVALGPDSMSTYGIRVRANATAAGTASAGNLGISGTASTDVFYVTVFGN